VLTEPGPSVIPVIPYAFTPFPSPSSGPPIPGVYPASSPDQPPPVDSPALVPDFAPAWTEAYQKAKAKVGISNTFRSSQPVTLRRAIVGVTYMSSLRDVETILDRFLSPFPLLFYLPVPSVRHVPSPNFRLAEPAALTRDYYPFLFNIGCNLVARGKGQRHYWRGLDVWPLCWQYPSHRRLSRSVS
jgi:hypothetical protein